VRKRLDLILFERGLFENKNKASANILAGNVKINGETVLKAGTLYNPGQFEGENALQIEIHSMPYVSRGGLKLCAALNEFKIDLKDRVAIDIGASAGGFTDCMLQAGALKVFAVDTGINQLDWRLRQDKRVIIREKTNVKIAGFEDVFGTSKENYEGALPDFMAMDLSFISVKKVLGNVLGFLAPEFEAVILIKPQFEAQRAQVQKGGIVKDTAIHNAIIEDIATFAQSLGLEVSGITTSPITGSKSGNIEYLMYLSSCGRLGK